MNYELNFLLPSHIKNLRLHPNKELKNCIGILSGQVVFKLQVKTVKMLFKSITEEPLDLRYLNLLFLPFLVNLL